MPIPEFNQIKPPALQFLSDGNQRKISEVDTALAKEFNLSQEEQNELLPSGTQCRWRNRVNWACYDLFRAGLFDRPKRGVYVITESGKKLAQQKPTNLDREFLMQFPQFVKFAQATGVANPEGGGGKTDGGNTESKTPQESIEFACQTLYTALKKDLLDSLKQAEPFRFQQIVIDVLTGMGYGEFRTDAAQIGKKSNDEGIDGIINEDKLGLDGIYVQAKRWQQTVGRPEIQAFVGALAGQQAAHKGVLITTSDFSASAIAYAKSLKQQKIILIDGDKLTDLMIQYNIGVSLEHKYEIKRIDSDYFEQ